MQWYREALAQDGTYVLAALNLGAALILRGASTPKAGVQPDFPEAVAILSKTLEHAPQSPEILNNLGVALCYDERPRRAQEALIQARTMAPAYTAPVWNLRKIAEVEKRQAEAQHYHTSYEQLVGQAVAPQNAPLLETIAGLIPGSLEEHVPSNWGKATRSPVSLEGDMYMIAQYPAGILTLSRDGEILMLMPQEGYRGKSAQGIMVGSLAQEVLKHYGSPSRRHRLPQGESWAYDKLRIAFQLRADKVVSWLRF